VTAGDRRPAPHAAARSLVVALLVLACGTPIDPITTVAPPSTRPPSTATPSGVPFAKSAYPTGGDAPCGQAAPPDPSHAAYTGNLKRITARDAATVVFELCAPDAAFLAKIASPAFSINDSGWLRSHITTGATGSQAIVDQINGTGPYLLEGWDHGSEISLARNGASWADPARNERVIVRWGGDPSTQVAELQDGTVDGIAAVTPTDVTTVTDDVGLTLKTRPGLNVFYLGFTNTFAPFDNEKVRLAIAIGIDRQHIVDTHFPAGSLLASSYTPCVVPHGCTGTTWYDYDPTLAKETLTAAGFPDGFDTTIHYEVTPRPSLPDPIGVATELKDELLANLGIRATLVAEPADTYRAAVDAGKVDGIHLLGQTATIPDVTAFLGQRFGPGASAESGPQPTDIGKAIAAGAATADPAKRDAAYAKANGAIRTHVPLIPIASTGSAAAFRADVDGAGASPLGLERFAGMTPGDRRQLVWLTGNEPPGLYCADETDPVSSLVCAQVMDTLYAFEPTGAGALPSLARTCDPNGDLTVWTCTLRSGVRFGDGSALDASDVVLSFAVQWDAEHPLHRGRTGTFATFGSSFGGFLNPPAGIGG
jgi:peptide/nickel transport system substrate-binding protein